MCMVSTFSEYTVVPVDQLREDPRRHPVRRGLPGRLRRPHRVGLGGRRRRGRARRRHDRHGHRRHRHQRRPGRQARRRLPDHRRRSRRPSSGRRPCSSAPPTPWRPSARRRSWLRRSPTARAPTTPSSPSASLRGEHIGQAFDAVRKGGTVAVVGPRPGRATSSIPVSPFDPHHVPEADPGRALRIAVPQQGHPAAPVDVPGRPAEARRSSSPAPTPSTRSTRATPTCTPAATSGASSPSTESRS